MDSRYDFLQDKISWRVALNTTAWVLWIVISIGLLKLASLS
jgi:hypothetical protein